MRLDGTKPQDVGPRLALQLIHEAALCRTGLRHRRTLNQRIFELANGLPFLASDMSVHELLGARTVVESLDLQVALGKIRRASGHFRGRLLAVDPHRVRSYTKRHMRPHRKDARERAVKTAQTFFILDVDTGQPVCFTTGTSARTAASAAEELLKLAGEILNPGAGESLVLADTEHFSVELMDRVKTGTRFDLLVPMHNRPSLLARLAALPPGLFRPRWAGYATAKLEYTPRDSQAGPFYQYVQRQGERPEEYRFNAFLATRDGDEVEELAGDFPKRWHVEEFFNSHQALGWDRGDVQPQHPLRPDDDGADRPGGDRSDPQAAGPARDELGRQAHGHGLLRGAGGGRAGQRRYDRRDVLQRPRCGQAARALRGLAGEAAGREDRPAGPLALRVHGRLPLPLKSNKPTPKNRCRRGEGRGEGAVA